MRNCKVSLVHPDLGLGGAERLILDLKHALSMDNHEVCVYTSYHDEERCFEDTVNTHGKRLPCIHVHGSWFPRSILGRFHAVCANLRCLWLVVVALLRDRGTSDLWVVDQVATPLILLKLFRQRTLYYCHFPDCLLSQRDTVMQKVYRMPLDYLEECCVGLADQVVVNSRFTKRAFLHTFKSLYAKGVDPIVLYPTAIKEVKHS